MKVEKSSSPRFAFAVNEQSIRRLVDVMSEYFPQLEFSVDCSDGSTLHPASIDELLKIPNTDSRQIRSIGIKSPFSLTEMRAVVKLHADDEYGPLSYRLWGEDKEVYFFAQKLDDWFSSVRQRYSPVNFSPGARAMMSAGVWTLGIVLAIEAHRLSGGRQALELGFVVLGILLVILSLIGTRIRRWLFPTGMFAIGIGLQRYQHILSVRKRFSIGAFILSVLASLVGYAITRLVGSPR